jgi:hypothetical protein
MATAGIYSWSIASAMDLLESCSPGRLTEIMVNKDSRFRSKDQKETALLLFCSPSVSQEKMYPSSPRRIILN